MKWESPSWIDIRMDAEIGSYQSDFVGEDNPLLAEQDDSGASPALDAD